MSDRSYVDIKIGGKITPSNLDLLNQLAIEEGCQPSSDNPAQFYAEEVPGGELSDLEALCRELGLTYAVYQGGYTGSYGPTVVYWRPGMDEVKTWTASFEGWPCLDVGDIVIRQAQGTLGAELVLMREAENIPALTLKDE